MIEGGDTDDMEIVVEDDMIFIDGAAIEVGDSVVIVEENDGKLVGIVSYIDVLKWAGENLSD